MPKKKNQTQNTGLLEKRWNEQYENLRKYVSKKGTFPSPKDEYPKGNLLGHWLARQQLWHLRGTLPLDRKNLLDKIGNWQRKDIWMQQYNRLLQYKKKYPKQWPTARELSHDGARIGLWCHLQRQKFKKGELSKERVALLNKLGFPWKSPRSTALKWEQFYQRLEQFRKANPDRWPDPNTSKTREKELAKWCTSQRYKKKLNGMQKNHIKQLNALGFPWKREGHPRQSSFEVSWFAHRDDLLAFRKKHGRDPLTGVKNVKEAKLASWCAVQRKKRKEGQLPKDKTAELNKIGFAWKLKTGPKAR